MIKRILFFSLIVLLIGCKRNNSFIEEVISENNIDIRTNTLDSINSEAKQFVLGVIAHYNYLLDSLVITDYHKSFILSQSNNLSIEIILSTSRESIIVIDTSENNTLTTYVTNYPAQLYFFSGRQINKSPWTLERIIETFDNENSPLGIHSSVKSVVTSFNYDGIIKKIFDLKGFREIIVLRNSNFNITDINDELMFSKKVLVSFLNNDRDFNWVADRSDFFGKYLFKIELLEIYTSSELFRKTYIINNYLKKDAEELLSIKSRLEKDINYNFPIEKLIEKTNNLQLMAEKYGLTSEESNEILKYPPYFPDDHFFLFYYKSYATYMWFWIIINFIVGVIFTLLLYLFQKNIKKIIALKTKYLKLGIFGLISFINYELFNHAPDYLPFTYFILPFLSYIILCLVLSILKREKLKNCDAQQTV